MNKIKKKIRNLIIIAVAFVFALSGIFLPGIFLKAGSDSELNIAVAAPADYYSGAASAVARNTSSKLSEFQKAQLISGVWDSSRISAEKNESLITEYEAVATAQDILDELYEKKLYPSQIKSDYGNWYSWSANFRRATDTTFNTYTAYYWVISFNRYDALESHTVILTENGTLLLAYADNLEQSFKAADINDYFETFFDLRTKEYSHIDVTKNKSVYEEIIPEYQDVDTSALKLDKLGLVAIGRDLIDTEEKFHQYFDGDSSDDMEFYYIYQRRGEASYAIGIAPYVE